MLHFFGILTPPARPSDHKAETSQKPFFSDDWRLTKGERDAALLTGKLPPFPEQPIRGEERDARIYGLSSVFEY